GRGGATRRGAGMSKRPKKILPFVSDDGRSSPALQRPERHPVTLSIFTKGLILLAVMLTFRLGFLGVIGRMQGEYAEAHRWATHSQQVIRDVQSIARATADAEIGAHRFAVAPQTAEFAEPYD